jgi:Sporulation and spore germination/Immunoglobulin-like domain of bacterial spore germination
MTRLARRPAGRPLPFSVALVVALALVATACSPASGPLGTPATPPASDGPSIEIPSSDVTPPASATPSPAPTAAPTATASPSGSGGASPGPTATRTLTPTPAPTATPAGTAIVRAYFFLGSFTGSGGLAPVLREVPETKAVARAAMMQLLAGPNARELGARPAMYTAIPEGTRLLDLSITDGVATVDLSREFESGGGSEGMFVRLAQVVYTLTQFPTVDAVRLELAGEPVDVFGSEGIVLDQPLTRADYREQLPAIFVDRPAWGAALGNPGAVAGLANVFEATFRVQVMDAAGGIVADRQVMAGCGTGCWGTFKATVEYRVNEAQWGTLRVFNLSARDGTPENVTEYPVWLTR